MKDGQPIQPPNNGETNKGVRTSDYGVIASCALDTINSIIRKFQSVGENQSILTKEVLLSDLEQYLSKEYTVLDGDRKIEMRINRSGETGSTDGEIVFVNIKLGLDDFGSTQYLFTANYKILLSKPDEGYVNANTLVGFDIVEKKGDFMFTAHFDAETKMYPALTLACQSGDGNVHGHENVYHSVHVNGEYEYGSYTMLSGSLKRAFEFVNPGIFPDVDY
jgi:hypothetical protein